MNDGRSHFHLNGFDLYEPATGHEMEYLLRNMRHEELEEGRATGSTDEMRQKAIGMCRRLVAVYHAGDLMCIGEMMDREGFRIISCERTVHCLERRHVFSWLKNFPSLVDWFRRSDDDLGMNGPFYTITPTMYPRALDLYGKAGGTVVGEINVAGMDFWLLDMNKKEG